MKISTLFSSLNLQFAFPLHLHKILLKNTSGFDDAWESRMVILRGVWSTLHPPLSPLLPPPDAGVPAPHFGWPSAAAVAGPLCNGAHRAHSLGLFGFPLLIRKGFNFCSSVFCIYSSYPDHSAPCEQGVACTNVYKLNSSISVICIHCLRLFCLSFVVFLLSTVCISPVSLLN